MLTDVSHLDTSTTVLGGRPALPFGIAPIGFTRLMQTEGETAGAGAAAAAGIPFALSTLGTTSIEDVRAAAPDGRLWYQLYVMKDRSISYGLVDRAAALVVVGLPHHAAAGVRVALLHRRHGRAIARQCDGPVDRLRRPRRDPRDVARQAGDQGRPDRGRRPEARRPHGADIVACLALGADFALVGRAYLYGLMSGGREGVDRAIEILASEVERTMKLLQVGPVAELEPRHVNQLRSLVPIDAQSLRP